MTTTVAAIPSASVTAASAAPDRAWYRARSRTARRGAIESLPATVEKVRGRTFRQAVYMRYTVVGLALFAVLMYFGLRNDLFGGGG